MSAKPCAAARLVVQLLICFTILLAFAARDAAASDGHVTAITPSPAPGPAPSQRAVTATWDVEYILWSPDCEQRVMIGINGEFPGPTITARAGDLISVAVRNMLHTEGVVIHWHGMKQIGTPWADGTASISQCPINPGETFVYNFTADKPGTFFYHGHYGMQRAAGLYGALIVEATAEQPEQFKYDGELNMLLSDWYHQNVYAQAAGLERKARHFQWIGEPQTILINGRGQYECTLDSSVDTTNEYCDMNAVGFLKDSRTEEQKQLCEGNTTVDEEKCLRRSECGPYCPLSQCAPVVYDVEPGKTYRLRIASTTSLSALNVQVQGHKMEVVEADGYGVVVKADSNDAKPLLLDNMDIYSGESYSVLLRTDQPPGSYWISVGVVGRHPKTRPALAILNYTTSPHRWPTGPPPETPAWDDIERSKKLARSLRAQTPIKQPELDSTSSIFRIDLLNVQTLVDDHTKWSVNDFTLALPPTPYLGAYYYGVQDEVFDTSGAAPNLIPAGYDIDKPPTMNLGYGSRPSSRVFNLTYGTVVDVVLQNADMLRDDVSETHPWHLHGHDFWVLGYGEGRYDGEKHRRLLNTADPPLRNTVVVFPHGWTVLRFVADNIGAWAFHCHIEPHLHMGMGVVIVEGMERVHELDVPPEAMACGVLARKAASLLTPAKPQSPAPAPAP